MPTAALEEQFKTMETWLLRVTRNKKGRDKYVTELINRFETMINGYNQLINFLNERYRSEGMQSNEGKKTMKKNMKPGKKPKSNEY